MSAVAIAGATGLVAAAAAGAEAGGGATVGVGEEGRMRGQLLELCPPWVFAIA